MPVDYLYNIQEAYMLYALAALFAFAAVMRFLGRRLQGVRDGGA